MQTRTWVFCVSLLALSAIGGCNRTPPAQTAPAAQPATESFQDFGNYSVHYNALRTDSLTPDIARSYGIQRSTNRVMLTVTILRKDTPQSQGKPVDGTVEVSAYNLNGQTKGIDMRRVSEGDAIYYIGEVSISGTEILVFDISATPTGEASPFRVKLQREFYSS
jgi:hypothetical protein